MTYRFFLVCRFGTFVSPCSKSASFGAKVYNSSSERPQKTFWMHPYLKLACAPTLRYLCTYLSVKPSPRIVVVLRPGQLILWDLTAADGRDQLPDVPSPYRSLFICTVCRSTETHRQQMGDQNAATTVVSVGMVVVAVARGADTSSTGMVAYHGKGGSEIHQQSTTVHIIQIYDSQDVDRFFRGLYKDLVWNNTPRARAM